MRLGDAYEPRRALPADDEPSLRPVLMVVRYPRSTPRSTIVRVVVAVPSPSKGALRRPPLRRASSTIVTRSFATRAPIFPENRLRLLSSLSAEKRGEIGARVANERVTIVDD